MTARSDVITPRDVMLGHAVTTSVFSPNQFAAAAASLPGETREGGVRPKHVS